MVTKTSRPVRWPVRLSEVLYTCTLFVSVATPLSETSLLNFTAKSTDLSSNNSSTIRRKTLNSNSSSHLLRPRREVMDRDALLDQDPRCNEFVRSLLIQSTSGVKDPSSQLLTSFFSVSMSHKRSPEYRFQTPNYPDYFPHDMDCIKIISAPTKDHRILLNFRGLFELEPEPHCLMDFFEIRDGAFGFSPILGRYCSRRLPDVGKGILSTGQFLWLRFHSDSTIRHRGFQAVYRFLEMPSRLPVDNVYRFRFRVDLKPGELLNLDENFLLENIRDFPPDLHHLPIEAAFDVRSTDDTHLMVHVANITVPRDFAWSCDPSELLAENPRARCLSDNPLVFGIKTVKREYHADMEATLDRLLIQDPNSIVDGRRTRFEVYPHRSISPYSPPCPKIRRFCDRSVGILNQDAKRECDRDFYTRKPRVVFRILIPSPVQKPNAAHARVWRKAVNTTQLNQEPKRSVRGATPTLRLPQMPTFQFHTTVLQKISQNPNAPCDEDWVACDAETCVPKKFWCDNTINCPQWQDEGPQCEINEMKSTGGIGKSSYELRKEQEKREADEEQMAAQMLHLSILGTLGLILLIITTTCIVMTMRRRKKEKRKHSLRSKTNITTSGGSPNRLGPRLNHVLSTDALLETDEHRSKGKTQKPVTIKINSVQGRQRSQGESGAERKTKEKTTAATVPNLWQYQQSDRPVRKLDVQLGDQVNHTVPANLFSRERQPTMSKEEGIRKGNQVTLRSPVTSGARGTQWHGTTLTDVQNTEATRVAGAAVNVSQMVCGTTSANNTVNSTYEQSRGSGAWRFGVSSPRYREAQPSKYSAATASPTDEQWVPGLAVSTSWKSQMKSWQLNNGMQSYSKSSLNEPKITVRSVLSWTQTPGGQHAANCRLVSRTQSWGDGMRTAGAYSCRSDKWGAMHSLDSEQVMPMEKGRVTTREGQRTGFFPNVNMTPIGAERLVPRRMQPSAYSMPAFVSMPNVNGSRSRQPSFEEECPKEGVTQGCKPPSAKRPRLNAVKQEAEARWIPTGYPTDTDGEWSSGTAMMDDNGSLMSDSAMPEMQDNPGAQSRATGCVPFIEYSPYKAPRPLSNMGVCTPTDPLVNNTFGGQNTYDMQNSTEGQSSESATYRSQSGASADDPYRSPRNDPRSWSDYSANSDKQSPANRFHEELNTESPSSKGSFIAEQMQQISPTIRMLQTKATKSRPPSDVMVYEYEA